MLDSLNKQIDLAQTSNVVCPKPDTATGHTDEGVSLAHLEKGINRRSIFAIDINLVHQKPLEALVPSKFLDLLVRPGFLCQKLITAGHVRG